MGRWDRLRNKYPVKPPDGTGAYLDKLRARMAEHQSQTLPTLLRLYEEQRKSKDELQDQLDETKLSLEALARVLVEQFETIGINSVKTQSGNTLFLKAEPYPSVEEREALERYIDDHADLAYLYTVHPQSLKALVQELLEEGRDAELPPGIKIFIKTNVQLRRS